MDAGQLIAVALTLFGNIDAMPIRLKSYTMRRRLSLLAYKQLMSHSLKPCTVRRRFSDDHSVFMK